MADRHLSAVVVALIVASLTPVAARSALFAVFSQRTAEPGDRVELHLVGSARVRAPAREAAIGVYLVENDIADSIRSPRDPRLWFVGTFDVDRRRYDPVRHAYPYAPLLFRVPTTLAEGTYTVAYDCPPCAAHSFGRTFFSNSVNAKNTAPSFRPRMTLVVEKRRGTEWKGPAIVGGLAAVALAAGLGTIRLRRRS